MTSLACQNDQEINSLNIPSNLSSPETSSNNAYSISVKPSTSYSRSALTRISYDYAPSAMLDENGRYRVWWCAGVSGDYVGYTETNSLGNRLSSGDVNQYFKNRAQGDLTSDLASTTFDGVHACDPSVIKVRNTYYMYYGGLSEDLDAQFRHKRQTTINGHTINLTKFPTDGSVGTTYIGVAKSSDGINWERLSNGEPIIAPHGNPRTPNTFAQYANLYGAGQPSAVYLNGLFYIVYTDTTGVGSNSGNGAGIYALRSADPIFKTGVEELRCMGDDTQLAPRGACQNPYWKSLANGEAPSTRYAVRETFSVDLSYSDLLKNFVVAAHGAQEKTELIFFTLNFKYQKSLYVDSPPWRDGPGIVRRSDGHLLPPRTTSQTPINHCGANIPIDLMGGVGGTSDNPSSWDLGNWGATLESDADCTPETAGTYLENALLLSPGMPLTFVSGGKRVQFEIAEPTNVLSKRDYNISNKLFHKIGLGLEVYRGLNMSVIGVSGVAVPAAYLNPQHPKQGRWNLGCSELVSSNGSNARFISIGEYLSHQLGGELFCIPPSLRPI